jgi:hypothetical protein
MQMAHFGHQDDVVLLAMELEFGRGVAQHGDAKTSVHPYAA